VRPGSCSKTNECISADLCVSFLFYRFKKPTGKIPGKGGQRWYKNVGLGFKTPKEAIEGMQLELSGMQAVLLRLIQGAAGALCSASSRNSNSSSSAGGSGDSTLRCCLGEACHLELCHPQLKPQHYSCSCPQQAALAVTLQVSCRAALIRQQQLVHVRSSGGAYKNKASL
jgi:hypothetical protein